MRAKARYDNSMTWAWVSDGGFRKRDLAVELQPVDDLVGRLVLGAHREPDQIMRGARGPEVSFAPCPFRRRSVQRISKVCSHDIVFVGLIGDHKIRGADPGKTVPEIRLATDARLARF
jgi:hypothetical protein